MWINFRSYRAGDRKSVGLSVHRTCLSFVWVVEIDLISLCGIDLDLILVWGSEMTWFAVGIENCLVLVFGSKLTRFMWGIETDLISV